jgi:hypothetical protein
MLCEGEVRRKSYLFPNRSHLNIKMIDDKRITAFTALFSLITNLD